MKKGVIFVIILFLVALSLLGIFLISKTFTASNSKDDPRYDPEYWHLGTVEIVEELPLLEEPYQKKLTFTSKNSTNNFELRFFYDMEVGYGSEIPKKILQSLIGFSVEMYEIKSAKKIGSYKVVSDNFKDNHAFNRNVPFSFWLLSGIKVKRNHQYQIVVKMPSKKDTDSILARPILVGGAGLLPSL
ncbi:MAG: hypothetical protein GX075_08270 [Firmicutes bacterium]|nr:hypothetical protein [Bacillota bacterium]